MKLHRWFVSMLLSAALVACNGAPEPGSTDAASAADPSVVALSPTPPVPSPKAWVVPAEAAECEGGWDRPSDEEVDQAVALIQRIGQIKGRFKVQDARTFTGPESPPRDVGPTGLVTRWYIKGGVGEERGRFLVESRQFGFGVVAVAPYETRGFVSPDWTGFQFDGSDVQEIDGLPGRWVGVPYDFVAGGEGLNLPGLPAAMASCLDGT